MSSSVENTILIVLAVLPVILLALYVYKKDKFGKEPLWMLIKAFFFGCLSVLPAIFIEKGLTSLYYLIGGGVFPGFIDGAYNGYIVAGCSEEFCKLTLLALAVWKSREFDEYFDGIVYAAFVSLGFAGLENFVYVFGQESFGESLLTGGMRAILSVPAHFLFGVAMGYYFALAKFQPHRRRHNLTMAFVVPMLLHGTFDALLMIPEASGENQSILAGICFPIFIYFDVLLWKNGKRKLEYTQKLSEQQHDSVPRMPQGGDPLSGINWDI